MQDDRQSGGTPRHGLLLCASGGKGQPSHKRGPSCCGTVQLLEGWRVSFPIRALLICGWCGLFVVNCECLG